LPFCIHVLQMKSLKDLGLDVLKGSVTKEDGVIRTKFYITRSYVSLNVFFLN
jgi:hypothetical protein